MLENADPFRPQLGWPTSARPYLYSRGFVARAPRLWLHRLWLLRTTAYFAAYFAAQPHCHYRGSHKDQYPVVSREVLVNQYRGGRCGERRQGTPGDVVYGVCKGGGPHTAGQDTQVAEDEAGGYDGPNEEGQDYQPV